MLGEAEFARIKAEVEKHPPSRQPTDTFGLPGPETDAELFALITEQARQGVISMPEEDAVEVMARLLDLDKSQISEAIKTLKPLGYAAVVERLGEIKAKAKPGKRGKRVWYTEPDPVLRHKLYKAQRGARHGRLGLPWRKPARTGTG